MNKYILLGCLVPCFASAMDVVMRIGSGKVMIYGKGMERVERKMTAKGYIYRAHRINLLGEMECTALGEEAAEKFNELEKAYLQQTSKEDHE